MPELQIHVRQFVPVASQRAVRQAIETSAWFRDLEQFERVRAWISRAVPAGESLTAAHGNWKAEWFPKVETPTGFPRQPDNTPCPADLLLVSVECIRQLTPGMGSHYGFKGYFVSLLISPDPPYIWDARGEMAE
jgi:hypothetical protein